MKVRFLGTGAADWHEPDKNGEFRRYTSTLIDGHVLIDITRTVLDQISGPAAITEVFFTHSHKDHFDIEALRTLAPCRVYAHESWANEITGQGLSVYPLKIAQPVKVGELCFIPMPANHSTERKYETPLHYLIEEGDKRILYATDGAWLLNQEHHIIGNKKLDAAVFDATIGEGHSGDYRIFEHNSIEMLRVIAATLFATGRLREGAPIYLTHMARTLHPSHEQLQKTILMPFVPCYDGMEVDI